MEGLESIGNIVIVESKFEEISRFWNQKRVGNGLGGLWEHSLDPRGIQTRLVESLRAQMSSRGGKKDCQKGAKMLPRTLVWRLLQPFWSEHVIKMVAKMGKIRKM